MARLERLGTESVQKVQTWWVVRDPAGLLSGGLPVSPGSTEQRQRPAPGVMSGGPAAAVPLIATAEQRPPSQRGLRIDPIDHWV